VIREDIEIDSSPYSTSENYILWVLARTEKNPRYINGTNTNSSWVVVVSMLIFMIVIMTKVNISVIDFERLVQTRQKSVAFYHNT
jgi:hypothetical protein